MLFYYKNNTATLIHLFFFKEKKFTTIPILSFGSIIVKMEALDQIFWEQWTNMPKQTNKQIKFWSFSCSHKDLDLTNLSYLILYMKNVLFYHYLTLLAFPPQDNI